eukprot:CAMPEP_0185755702 /NCGR_PEP_ID=MMETSP1174-20130828/14172_1 /TAXON_ID=35687 /ORGANISM="Dictyocha speculum, Strain CCMP1381" /LENGTH=103 /DNA_ID=CAMNT_0028434349 /DNA_START=45 /DNA_END=353 /DNA_ORIENTATION=-
MRRAKEHEQGVSETQSRGWAQWKEGMEHSEAEELWAKWKKDRDHSEAEELACPKPFLSHRATRHEEIATFASENQKRDAAELARRRAEFESKQDEGGGGSEAM